ncbi:hypothetical protein Bbelb_037580 [Branchiostoma belcheri]|nr:hypothetical protein Bbelb_037580 [Branchiostoma belcheri]
MPRTYNSNVITCLKVTTGALTTLASRDPLVLWLSRVILGRLSHLIDAKFRKGFPALPLILSVKALLSSNPGLNPRHAARDTLLFYTEHQCRHIRLCPVRAKLPASANDSGFRTVETISVHGEGFKGSQLRNWGVLGNIEARSRGSEKSTFFLLSEEADFAMSILRCRLQQEYTG